MVPPLAFHDAPPHAPALPHPWQRILRCCGMHPRPGGRVLLHVLAPHVVIVLVPKQMKLMLAHVCSQRYMPNIIVMATLILGPLNAAFP